MGQISNIHEKEIQQGPTKRPSCKAGESNPGGPLGWCPLNSL
jgi:hypothetical protein